MAKKAFFAAFVIDEEAYAPEPGPVDRHFVVADLAQSSFGEQSGVSNFIVWESAEDLIIESVVQSPRTICSVMNPTNARLLRLRQMPARRTIGTAVMTSAATAGPISTCRRRRYHLSQSAHHFAITFRRRCVTRSPSNISR